MRRARAAVALVALLGLIALLWVLHVSQREADALRAQILTERAAASKALARAEADAREKQAALTDRITKVTADAQDRIDRARRGPDRASAGRLHDAAAAAGAELARDSCAAVAESGASSPAADVVPADLFRWADGRAGELAAEADEARARGDTCELAYLALSEAINTHRCGSP